MKITSKLISLILVLILAFLLVACENESKNQTITQTSTTVETTRETEQVTEESTQSEIDYDNLVVDAVFEELTDPFSSQVCYYHIPKVNLSDGLADKINEKMLTDGEEFMSDAYDSIDMDVSIISSGYNYLWGYKDNVVSVLAAEFFNTPGLHYNIYNMDMETGEILTNSDLVKLYNFTEEEMINLIIKKSGEKFEEKYIEIKEQVADFYNMQYQSTVAAENAEKAVLYINENGDLCCVATIYSMAGAPSYDHVINLTGDTPAKDPDVM